MPPPMLRGNWNISLSFIELTPASLLINYWIITYWMINKSELIPGSILICLLNYK